jgi:hypothetical protein
MGIVVSNSTHIHTGTPAVGQPYQVNTHPIIINNHISVGGRGLQGTPCKRCQGTGSEPVAIAPPVQSTSYSHSHVCTSCECQCNDSDEEFEAAIKSLHKAAEYPHTDRSRAPSTPIDSARRM